MQILTIAGNVGKDGKLNHPGGSDAVLNFSLAVDNGKDRDGNDRPPTWYDCAIWGKRAEALEKYITKGTKLTVSGRPSARAYEGKAYLGITINELTFHGSGGQRSDSAEPPARKSGGEGGAPAGGFGSDDDTIPFAPEWR